jgi:WD40 repeat protein
VLMFEPHRDYVSSMRWLGPSGQGLLTGSYDGLVRRLDVETGGQHWWGVLRGGRARSWQQCASMGETR